VKGTLLRTFKIFADGIPAEYKGEPIIAGLFVTPEKLESARRSVGQKGSKLNVFYEHVCLLFIFSNIGKIIKDKSI
jgi:hypothetical protein